MADGGWNGRRIWLGYALFSLAAVASGTVTLFLSESLPLFVALNGIAWVAGAVLSFVILIFGGQWVRLSVLPIAVAALAAVFLFPDVDGVHRWLDLGPLAVNAAALFLPITIVAMAQTGIRKPLSIGTAALILTILIFQPDASQTTAFAVAVALIVAYAGVSPRARVIALGLLLATIALACTHKLELAILAIGLCHLGVAWFHDLPQSLSASRLRDLWTSLRSVSMSRVYQLGWLTFPLGIAYGLAALEISAPRFVVQSQLGERELGILGVMIYVTMIGQLVVASVAHAAIPRMAKCSARGDLKAVRKLVLKVVAIGACAGLGTVVFAWLFGDLFLRVVFSVEYAAYQPLLVAVSVAASFSFVSAMLSTSLRALQFFRSVCILHAIGFIIIMGTCWYTVSQHGLNGAALGMVVSAALTSLLFGGAFLFLMGLRTRELKYA